MKRFLSIFLLTAMLLSVIPSVCLSVFAQESAEPVEIPVKWNVGYIGSNVNTNKNKIVNGSASFRYSDIIHIEKAGTKITFTDTGTGNNAGLQNSAYVFSTWNAAGTAIDLSGTNVVGTYGYSSIGQTPVEGGMKYEFITDKDDQYIRLGFRWTSGDSESPKVYTQSTSESSTKKQFEALDFTEVFNADGTVSGIQWFCGYASSASNTNGSAKETKWYSNEYAFSGLIKIPKAGTEISYTLTQSSGTNSNYNSFTVYKFEGGRYVYDNGIDANNTLCKSQSGSKYTFTYVSSNDNEVIRLCCRPGKGYKTIPVDPPTSVTWRATDKEGTLESLKDQKTEWPDAEILSLKTAASLSGKEVEAAWHPGYIGSQYHDSAAFVITSPSNQQYRYSDVITIPKAGTSLYFFDQTYIDFGDSSYASTSALTLSHWKEGAVPGSWVIDRSKVYYTGCDCPSILVGKDYRVYCYTSTEDNEKVRLCLRTATPLQGEEHIIAPIYLVEKTDFTALTAATGNALKESSYTECGGSKVSFKIYLPKDYKSDKQYTLVFDNSSDGKYAERLAQREYTGIAVSFNGEVGAAIRLLDELIAHYPVKVSDILFVGGDELASHLVKYQNLRLAEALLYTGTGSQKAPKDATLKKASEFSDTDKSVEWLVSQSESYFTILEGVEMYAIGDSYFGGSQLGQHQTWVNLLGYKYNMTFHNYGIGGNTVAQATGQSGNQPPMYTRYGEMPGGADIYIVEGGRNDRHYNVPFGENKSLDPRTLKGALNVIISGIRKRSPDALIVLVTPWSHATETGYLGTNNDYADAIKELAEYYNDPHIVCAYAADTEKTGIDASDGANRYKYFIKSSDVSHLNADGMNLVLPFFEDVIVNSYAKLKGISSIEDQSKLEMLKKDSGEDTKPIETETDEPKESSTNTPATSESTTSEPKDSETSEPKEKGCRSAVISAYAVLAVAIAALAVIKKRED